LNSSAGEDDEEGESGIDRIGSREHESKATKNRSCGHRQL